VPVRLPLLLIALWGAVPPSLAAAQGASENAEARVYFEEGNRLYQAASRARGEQRSLLLQRALEAYVDSLQVVRSRNALFNAAIVLGELERYDESFNYFSEYLRIESLSSEERSDARRRRDALRDRIAVFRVETEPAGALLRIDRTDLAPAGETPIELAVPPGDHTLFLERTGFLPIEATRAAMLGETILIAIALEVEPLGEPESVPEPEPISVESAPEPAAQPRLRNAAIGTAASTLATAAVGLGLSLKARSLRDEYDQAAAQYRMSGEPADLQRAEALADRTDRFNLVADVFWATTIALGISAITLYGVHRRRAKRETPEISVAASPRGAFASLRMSIGARP
jgi:tetratricopeptide (TPR) repeat protein